MRASVRPSPSTARRAATARHVILPGQLVAQTHPRRRETVQRFLARSGWHFALPTICEIDGTPVLRAHRGWRRRRIRAGEHVEFVSRPLGPRGGGAGKSVLGLVAMIALSALAPGLGTVLAGTLGTLGGQLAAGAIMAGIGFGLNTFLSPKVANKSEDTTKTLYDFGAQSNSARLGETLPVQYGRLKKKPDFIALPWTQYVGDDAYIHVLLNDGEGRYQREQIDVGTATLWTAANGLSSDFRGVEIAFYEPNEPITLFPTDVVASAEVTGQARRHRSGCGRRHGRGPRRRLLRGGRSGPSEACGAASPPPCPEEGGMTTLPLTGWLADTVPWWVWLAALVFGLAATWQFWAPTWALLPRPVRMAVAALAAGILAYIAGRNHGATNERARQDYRRAAAGTKRKEIDHEVQALPGADLDRRLDRWMRD